MAPIIRAPTKRTPNLQQTVSFVPLTVALGMMKSWEGWTLATEEDMDYLAVSILLAAVLVIRALLFGVNVRAP